MAAAEQSMQLEQAVFRLGDWYPHYGPRPAHPCAGEWFLAEAFMELAEKLCEPFYPLYPMWACLPALPRPEAASVDASPSSGTDRSTGCAAGAAVSRLTDLLGGPVTGDDDLVWVRLHSELTAGRDHLAEISKAGLSLDAIRSTDSSGDMDHEWLEAEIDEWRELGWASRLALYETARGISRLVSAGEVRLLSRPAGTNEALVALDPGAWDADDPLRMVARCAIELPDAGGGRAGASHRIFVAREGFSEAIGRYADAHRVELFGSPPPEPAPSSVYPLLEADLRRDVELLMYQEAHRHWRRPQLKAALAKLDARWKKLHRSVFERVRLSVVGVDSDASRNGPPTRQELIDFERLPSTTWDRDALRRTMKRPEPGKPRS